MTITFLGTGTSQGVPVIACACPVCISKNIKDKRLRSSVLIETCNKSIVIDTGPDFRYQMLRAHVSQLDAILFTHEHKDHVAGLDDVRAFNFKQQAAIPVYAKKRVLEALNREFHYVFSDQRYPGIPQLHIHEIGEQKFDVAGEISVLPINVMHFKLPVNGFRIGGFTYITDAKTISDREIQKIKGTEILVLNALQKEKHISHLTLEEAIELAHKVNPRRTYLTHISHKLGRHEDVSATLPLDIGLAYDGLKLVLED